MDTNEQDRAAAATPEQVSIPTADGFELGGTLHRASDADTVVIVHGATAVPHRFYRRFADYLHARGWSVLTYDFRGIGASRPESLVGFACHCSDWGLHDMPAALDWVQAKLEPRKIYFVGHSAGGQQAGLMPRPDRLDAMATVSSQSGYWRYQGGSEKYRVLLMVTVVMPLLARLLGYLPWSRLASGEDIPRDAALQWARWCRSPDYLLGDKSLPTERYADFVAPVLALSIDDDMWGTAKSVDAMMSAYPNVERRHIVPSAFGLQKIGHMGFFRQGSESLWELIFTWLRQH